MDIKLFSKIVKKLNDSDLEDFECTYDGKKYGFKDVGDNKWDDQGKYQYKKEDGQLIEINEKYQEIQSFNFGVSRSVQRSGSYFSDYDYDEDPYVFFEIKEILVPKKIIPAYIDTEWIELKIDLENIVDEEEEKAKQIEVERIRLEEETKAEKERLTELYSMNNRDIIQEVNKNFKKQGITNFNIQDMRKEYFDIVVKGKLENQDWIDYHEGLQKNT